MTADSGTERPAAVRPGRFAWVALLFGIWIVGGFVLILWADAHGLTIDVAASPYHIPGYLGFLALAVTCGGMAIAARRSGRSWRQALPPGYGTLGAGLLAMGLTLILDVGWREGVGIGVGIEQGLAPSRVALAIALVLIAATPLRAALVGAGSVPTAAILVSAGLTLGVVAWPAGFHPFANPWLEQPADLQEQRAELWMMDADGSHQTQLIVPDAPSNLGYASWSSDGSMIGYTRFDIPDSDVGNALAGVWTAAPDGTDQRELVAGAEFAWIPHWSPDGTWVAYTREAPGGPWMDSGPVGPGPAAGPQGGAVVGPLTAPLPQADIWRISAAGDEPPQQLTDSEGDDRAPVYSPDGSRILFDSTRDGNTEIYVMAADGSDEIRLTDDAGEDWGASWSPDGSHISFNSSRAGDMDIYVMNADGTGVERLTRGPGANTSPTWSPDGTRIAYAARGFDDRGQIWSMNADGSDPRNLSGNAALNDAVWTGGWGPDGRIVFSRLMPGLPESTAIVRQDLGAASILVTVALLAGLITFVVRTSPRFGSFALVLGLGAVLAALPEEAWRFVPAGIATGLAVDIAVWRAPQRRRSQLAAATAGLVFVLATGGVVIATTGLDWSPTLLLGVALAAAAIGWGIGALGEAHGRARET